VQPLARISGGVGAVPTEVNYGASVRPRRSLVGSLNFESWTPFHGLATLSGGQHAVENGVLSPSDGNENWARGVTGFSPLQHIALSFVIITERLY